MLKKLFWFAVGAACMLLLIGAHKIGVWHMVTGPLAGVLVGAVAIVTIHSLVDDTRSWLPVCFNYGVLLAFTWMNLDTDGRNLGFAALAGWTFLVLLRSAPILWAWLTKKDEEALDELIRTTPANK